MNERIRDLQIQAFAECKTFEDDKVRTDDVFERFAELIVRECMNLVKDCYAEPESAQSLYQTACASTIIEDHFGVEE